MTDIGQELTLRLTGSLRRSHRLTQGFLGLVALLSHLGFAHLTFDDRGQTR